MVVSLPLAQLDLRDIRDTGTYLRAFCPIHGSDHQRSLSIHKASGRGRCFCCQERVIVPELAASAGRSALHRSASPPSWQHRETALLKQLAAHGVLRLDREEAWNAQAYLEARHIPLAVAQRAGVSYLAPGAAKRYGEPLLARWEDRLLFPLALPTQPEQRGYAGRLLTGWQSVPHEGKHKEVLAHEQKPRWIKTNPAGWFWQPFTPAQHPIPLILVEGPFDRLALLSAGFAPEEVISLVGIAPGIEPGRLPLRAGSSILLAFDSDPGGKTAAKRLQQQLRQAGYDAVLALPHTEGQDWSALWSRAGRDGLDALYAYHALLAHEFSSTR
uniref:Toprim domain-containing protein n=1 Tax=Thermosporothrix sp. COM3 TaxID=2490863 RepID=A0A455SBY6_9CHLR|nr:hypothetical protein KTC_00270 [Thermosporothrix sp. COM3]